tara:strand:+ start:402 stop:590 length:189 start_codon:yes stop_codon:yes gene_type:complete
VSKIFILLLLILISCAYPDIDTVPKFENINITLQESVELCKVNSDNNLSKCLEEINKIASRL